MRPTRARWRRCAPTSLRPRGPTSRVVCSTCGVPRPSASHPAEHPAGDVDGLALYVVRPRRAQEEHATGRLLGCRGAAERDQHRGHLAQLLGDAELHLLAADLHAVLVVLRLGEAGVDEAEGDGVDVDLELAPLLRDRKST